ncbi:hypothetical protein KIN20_008069 [Parelaphostrongylus tenuis]|uniref:Uncharacterized protein n=1 Tax=Parelaphostrongylus tenuis TaxID=148309 RepID=A0AAD5MPY2_PARTN|nr:hypothetical protein KIN20_008069 [Parelaphostrongylus tenuis]
MNTAKMAVKQTQQCNDKTFVIELKQDGTASVEATQSASKPVSRAQSVAINQSKKAVQQKSQGAIEASGTELDKDADVAHETTQYHQPISETTPVSRTRNAIVAEVYDL